MVEESDWTALLTAVGVEHQPGEESLGLRGGTPNVEEVLENVNANDYGYLGEYKGEDKNFNLVDDEWSRSLCWAQEGGKFDGFNLIVRG